MLEPPSAVAVLFCMIFKKNFRSQLPVKIRHSEDILAIWQPDEDGIFVFLSTKEDLGNRITTALFCADSTNAICFAHQPTANMVAWQDFDARLVTSGPVTNLVALLVALVMLTFPRTRMATRSAWLSASLITSAVDAAIFTRLGTWRAWHAATLFTAMRTN